MKSRVSVVVVVVEGIPNRVCDQIDCLRDESQCPHHKYLEIDT